MRTSGRCRGCAAGSTRRRRPRRAARTVAGSVASALDDLDPAVPGPVTEPARVPGERPDVEPGGEQLRDQPAADVPGHPGDQGEAPLAARQTLQRDGAVGRFGLLGHSSSLRSPPRSRTSWLGDHLRSGLLFRGHEGLAVRVDTVGTAGGLDEGAVLLAVLLELAPQVGAAGRAERRPRGRLLPGRRGSGSPRVWCWTGPWRTAWSPRGSRRARRERWTGGGVLGKRRDPVDGGADDAGAEVVSGRGRRVGGVIVRPIVYGRGRAADGERRGGARHDEASAAAPAGGIRRRGGARAANAAR